MKLTQKALNLRKDKALRVLVFTEATYRWLYANDPQALRQAVSAFTTGELTVPEAEYIGRMRTECGPLVWPFAIRGVSWGD